jgi:glycosyltransferase involved in cell wall biosynthesis
LSVKDPKNLPSDDSQYFIDYPEMAEAGFLGKLKSSIAFFYNRDAKKKIEQLILAEKPDVAHIHLLFNGLSVSILPVLKKYHIPVVMTVHDYRLLCPAYLFLDGDGHICEKCRGENYLNCIQKKCSRKGRVVDAMLSMEMYFRNLFFPMLKQVDRFIFISNFASGKHIAFNPEYKKQGVRLYNYVPEKTSQKTQDDPYFLYYGRLSAEKGILTLLEAVKGLDIKLKIAGTGSLSFEAPENVELLGFKSGAELWNLIGNARFVIVPSEWYEPFGLTVVEPQMLGVPVIGANIGAIPELITDGETGYLFQSGSVSDLAKTIEKANHCLAGQYQKMSLNARKNAAQFSNPEEYYTALMNIYKSTIANG